MVAIPERVYKDVKKLGSGRRYRTERIQTKNRAVKDFLKEEPRKA